MGELLEIASWVGTPLGGICAVAFVTAMTCFFMDGGSSHRLKKQGNLFHATWVNPP